MTDVAEQTSPAESYEDAPGVEPTAEESLGLSPTDDMPGDDDHGDDGADGGEQNDDGESLAASPPVDEVDDVDFEGKKYRVPREIKDALLRQADYTRKTQEIAETRRQLEQSAQVQQQTLAEHAQLMAIDQQIAQFQGLNWNEVIDKDPVQAMKLQQQFSALQQQRGQVASRIQQAQQWHHEQQRAALAKQIEAGRAEVARDIKGWSPELARQLADYGKRLGYSEQEVGAIADPRAVKLLHKAFLYDQMAAKSAAPPKQPSAPAAKPAASLPSGKSQVKKDPAQMSDSEFDAWRRKQISKR